MGLSGDILIVEDVTDNLKVAMNILKRKKP